jgi:hypothetical protein
MTKDTTINQTILKKHMRTVIVNTLGMFVGILLYEHSISFIPIEFGVPGMVIMLYFVVTMMMAPTIRWWTPIVLFFIMMFGIAFFTPFKFPSNWILLALFAWLSCYIATHAFKPIMPKAKDISPSNS